MNLYVKKGLMNEGLNGKVCVWDVCLAAME